MVENHSFYLHHTLYWTLGDHKLKRDSSVKITSHYWRRVQLAWNRANCRCDLWYLGSNCDPMAGLFYVKPYFPSPDSLTYINTSNSVQIMLKMKRSSILLVALFLPDPARLLNLPVYIHRFPRLSTVCSKGKKASFVFPCITIKPSGFLENKNSKHRSTNRQNVTEIEPILDKKFRLFCRWM